MRATPTAKAVPSESTTSPRQASSIALPANDSPRPPSPAPEQDTWWDSPRPSTALPPPSFVLFQPADLRPSPLGEDAQELRLLARDLVQASMAANSTDGDLDRAGPIRGALARHPRVLLWCMTGKDLNAIIQAAELPSVAELDNPLLRALPALQAAIAANPDAFESARVLSHTTGAVRQAEILCTSLDVEGREDLLKNLPETLFTTLAEQIDAAIIHTRLSDAHELQVLLDPREGFDLTTVPPAFREFFETVLTSYFDRLPVEDKRRVAMGLLELPLGAGEDEKLAAILNNAGPAIQKLFQLFGEDVQSEQLQGVMAALKNQITPFPSALAVRAIERNLGGAVEDLFESFCHTPLAAASVGQVHAARLRDSGEEVIIKVLRPDIRERAAREIALLRELAPTVGTRSIIDRLEEALNEELDFTGEAKNLRAGELYNLPHKGLQAIRACKRFETTHEILVMACAPGSPLTATRDEALPAKARALGTLLETWYTEALFKSGFFHADLHAGNLFLDTSRTAPEPSDSLLTLIDFGSCGQLSRMEQRAVVTLVLGSESLSAELVMKAFRLLNAVPPEAEEALQDVVQGILAEPLTSSDRCAKIINTAIDRELALPKNFILFNRGRTFLEKQIQDTNQRLDRWEHGASVARPSPLDIYTSAFRWGLAQDMLNTTLWYQSSSEALLDGETMKKVAASYLPF